MIVIYKENNKVKPLKAYEEKEIEDIEDIGEKELLSFIFTVINQCLSILGLTKNDIPNVALSGIGMGQIGLSLTPLEMNTLKDNLIILDIQTIFEAVKKNWVLLAGVIAHEMLHFYQKKHNGLPSNYAKGIAADKDPLEIKADAFGIWFMCQIWDISEEEATAILCDKLSEKWYNERIQLAKDYKANDTWRIKKNIEEETTDNTKKNGLLKLLKKLFGRS